MIKYRLSESADLLVSRRLVGIRRSPPLKPSYPVPSFLLVLIPSYSARLANLNFGGGKRGQAAAESSSAIPANNVLSADLGLIGLAVM